MLKKLSNLSLATATAALLLCSSCTRYHRSIADANARVNFEPKDFTITGQYGGQATVTRVLGIDWARIFKAKTGSVGDGVSSFSIPVIGSILSGGHTADGYALYDLLKRNPNYDAIFYPQFQRKSLNVLWIYTKETSTVKARLGKLVVSNNDGDRDSDD